MPVTKWLWMCAVLALLAVPVDGDTGPGSVTVEWSDGRLSVNADGVPFRELLATISHQTGVQVRGLGTLTGSAYMHFAHLPLREGLKALLTHINYVIIEEPAAQGDAGHVVVLVFGHATDADPGTPAAQEPNSAPPAVVSGVEDRLDRPEELERMVAQGDIKALSQAAAFGAPTTQALALQHLAQQDPDEATRLAAAAATSTEVTRRVQAVQVLGELDSPAATDTLGAALKDPDLGVRYAAVSGLMGQTSPASLQFLVQALQDRDVSIRLLALELLAQRGQDGKPGVSIALSDSDASIRDHAQALWTQIE